MVAVIFAETNAAVRSTFISLIELISIGDWRMKLYGIAWRRELPRAELIESAKRLAIDELVKAAPNDYKVGFVGAHDGRNACFVFVDFWGNEDELFQRVFLSRSNDPRALTPARPRFRLLRLRLGSAPPIFRTRSMD